MTDLLADARTTGECLALRVFLRIEHKALQFLISDLNICAEECSGETEPTARTASRHRLALDVVITRFRNIVGHIPVDGGDGSVRLQIEAKLADFYKMVSPLLPRAATTPRAVTGGDTTDWGNSHLEAAGKVSTLAGELEPIAEELSRQSDLKDELSASLADASSRIRGIL